jgi:hypothetical protein
MQLHKGEVTLKNRLLQQGAEAKLRFPIKWHLTVFSDGVVNHYKII